MIDYDKILNNNMLNVFREILKNIKDNGLQGNNPLYIRFLTNSKNTVIPNWIKQKYPEEMTIVIQYEYYNLEINKDNFSITLSFNDIKSRLKISYESIISFADPSVNFGLILQKYNVQKKLKKNLTNKVSKKNNIINFSSYKKN